MLESTASTNLETRKCSLPVYKNRHYRIAKQLGYSRRILRKIENATSESEVDRAMIEGRNGLRD